MADLKFYHLSEAPQLDFCAAEIDGLVYSQPCVLCDGVRVTRPRSGMQLHWLVDGYGTGASDRIGDFVWPMGPKDLVVADSAFRFLKERLTGFHTAPPIKMVDDPILHRPRRITARTKPRVWLPYTGPKLHELVVDAVTTYEPKLSKRERWRYCDLCGDRISGSSTAPLIVLRKNWPQTHFFKVNHFYRMVFVTEPGRDLLKQQKFQNLSMRLYGRIVDK